MNPSVGAPSNEAIDLTECDREPIHIPGSIQPHGILLVLGEPDYIVLQVSANTQNYLGRNVQAVLGHPLQELFSGEQGALLVQSLERVTLAQVPQYLNDIIVSGNVRLHAIAHRSAGAVILELEDAHSEKSSFQNLYPLAHLFFEKLKKASSTTDLAQMAATEVRRITGFDRVLVYKFDSSWHGQVVAEAQDGEYPSYLDLWFPASDIPQQARRLYELSSIRLIADANYTPVPIVPTLNPLTGAPLDLSFASLRSVSPVHVEYLKNMGVASSMSVSMLVENGRLWGLIACHHRTPRTVSFDVRAACNFVAQALSVQMEINEQRADYEQRIRLKSIVTRLLGAMAQEDEFIQGLTRNPEDLLQFADATGAAVLYEDRCTLIGSCPAEKDIWKLVDWLVEQGREETYHTDCAPLVLPNGEAYRERASGILGISISKIYRSYVFWFRPEAVQTVSWGGDPQKSVEEQTNGSLRLHPRKSFNTWKEIVENRSVPWRQAEIEVAGELRNAIIGIVLRKAEELAELTAELQRSNKELEAFSYSVSHDLRAPFRHIVGYSELLKHSPTAQLGDSDRRYLETIIHSAQFAGTLVDNLLSFSQVGRTKLVFRSIDMGQLVAETLRDLDLNGERQITWHIDPLPPVQGDLMMLRLVWQNLIQNAVKYTRPKKEAVIAIGSEAVKDEIVFFVRDNGVGFDQAYAHKLFGVFQRLHRMEEFEGTGIGLANVRRIIARHGGRTWAEGETDKGACFYFSLPR